MMNYLSKKTIVVINRISTDIAGGINVGKSNLRLGQSLGFVHGIYHNSVFGQPIYPDIFHMAGGYLFYIIKNHPFTDGNKRTGLASAVMFLEQNEISLSEFEEDEAFQFIMAVAAGRNDPKSEIPHIAGWLKSMAL